MNAYISYFMLIIKRVEIFIVVVFVLLLGCAPGPIIRFGLDVTENEHLWGGYKYGQVYKLQNDMFLKVDETYPLKYKRVTIEPPGDLVDKIISYIPQSVSEYKKFPGRFIKVRGIIIKGTRIKCSHLIKYIPVGFEPWLYPFAEILDGEYAGIEVMIDSISLAIEDGKHELCFLKGPNYKLIVKAD
jgi:hypothetical protein